MLHSSETTQTSETVNCGDIVLSLSICILCPIKYRSYDLFPPLDTRESCFYAYFLWTCVFSHPVCHSAMF